MKIENYLGNSVSPDIFTTAILLSCTLKRRVSALKRVELFFIMNSVER